MSEGTGELLYSINVNGIPVEKLILVSTSSPSLLAMVNRKKDNSSHFS